MTTPEPTPEFTPEQQAYIERLIAAANKPEPELTPAESHDAIDAIRASKREVVDSHRVQGRPNAHQVAAWMKEYGRTRPAGPHSADTFNAAYRQKFGREPGN